LRDVEIHHAVERRNAARDHFPSGSEAFAISTGGSLTFVLGSEWGENGGRGHMFCFEQRAATKAEIR